MVRMVGKEGTLGAGGGGNCSIGMDGSRKILGDIHCVEVYITLADFYIGWGV